MNRHSNITDGGLGFEEQREARLDSVDKTGGREPVSVDAQNMNHDRRENKIGKGGAGDSSVWDRDDA